MITKEPVTSSVALNQEDLSGIKEERKNDVKSTKNVSKSDENCCKVQCISCQVILQNYFNRTSS